MTCRLTRGVKSSPASAEAFAAHDLPYVATAHLPSEEGDQRNHHGHIIFALRPLQHVGDHEWDAGRELRTEFDSKEHFTFYRKLFAEVMTEVTCEQGKQRIYTHLSHAERGLKNKPLIALGPAKTAAIRRGDLVSDNERNRREIARGEQLLIEDRARRRLVRQQQRISQLKLVHGTMIAPLAHIETSTPATVITTPTIRWEPASSPITFAPLQPIAMREPATAGRHADNDEIGMPMIIEALRCPRLEPVVAALALPTAVPSETLVHSEAVPLASSQDVSMRVESLDRGSSVEQPVKATRIPVASSPQHRTTVTGMASPRIDRPLAEVRRIGRASLQSQIVAGAAPIIRAQAKLEGKRVPVEGAQSAIALDPFPIDGLNQSVARKRQAPPFKSEEPVMVGYHEDSMRLLVEAARRAAERANLKARKRRGAGISPWALGGSGMGE